MNEEPYIPLIARPNAPIPPEWDGAQQGIPNYDIPAHEAEETSERG